MSPGFFPSIQFPVYTLSPDNDRDAPSTKAYRSMGVKKKRPLYGPSKKLAETEGFECRR